LRTSRTPTRPALVLYAKLDFTVYVRRKVRFAQRAGFTELLSMKLVQDAEAHP